MKFQILLLVLCMFHLYVDSKGLNCKVDTILDSSNKVEYSLKNDTTAIINVTINNNSIQKEYYYLKDSESCNFIPNFILKYKKNFIFLSGTHQHYRLLTMFQLEGNKIIVDKFENELMLESSNDELEKIFFLYNDQPAIVFIDNKNKAFIRLYKKHYSINHKNIKDITIETKHVIVSFKNNKKKVMSFKDFKGI
jgi:hypothetical protein